MSILLIGDPHYKKSNKDETEEMEKAIFKYLEDNWKDAGITKIIVLGDILDTHEKINTSALIRATNFLMKLGVYCSTYILVGNHDRPNNEVFLTEEHSLYPLKFNEIGVKIIDKVFVEGEFVFVPYVEPGRFMRSLGY